MTLDLMRFAARIFFPILFLAITYYLPLTTLDAFAQGEFQTDYQVTYAVGLNGTTNISQNITLKNKTANYYADKFELKIGSVKVENVQAKDTTGQLSTDVKFEGNTTIISVKFNQRVIGIDKTLPFSLSYSSPEIVTRSGQIWEISIPRLAKSADIASYTAKVSVPVIFGEVAFTIPKPEGQTVLGSQQEFTFTKEQLFQSGIAMSFGKNQVFSFELKYFLENNNLTNQYDYITLPPDNTYQRIVLQKIEPAPLDVTVDTDGNFLAKYKLLPRQQLNVTAKGNVEVFSKPFRKIEKELTSEEKERYTGPQKYWETDIALVKDKANELKTPQAIYNFVANSLSYNQERLKQPKIERKGAASALLTPNDAVCMEFTDLFVALARAAGIPAREVEGYAFTQNERLKPLSLTFAGGDILHAWPEYWDDNLGWIQVDPTWGSTSGGLDYFNKLDFNHITFVQRGSSSTSPLPPGSYKRQDNLQERNVFVSFAQELPIITSTPQLSLDIPEKILSGVPVKVTANIKNIGSTSIIGEEIILTSTKLKIITKAKEQIKILPPYSQKSFEFSLGGGKLFSDSQDTLVLSYGGVEISHPIKILPIYKLVLLPAFETALIIALILIVIGFALYYKINKRNLKFHQK
ncbi:hypothetical protein A2697_05320 [Candidatus Curtissbacteria bacterium RIFCSPHIGHO2_01_FULL_41_44]|uniref:Transglutaminase-like domain-containing protein n=1 Tax=Candidatus Curtissbacteria bacterium RIFCSPLOWO2_01_FULL_42_50 TaxID=1797730 RepID=A0A1F5H470_9BACT|nr:MAG: hypothetical protein A2697_05320 [Candidatus Curtissbacteria bacterium RIFCSPHIGHO2_01_FULL_41_44]OGD96869.1 MAG: hypothetical protein A3E71_00300 [Candidatus Curtissbacteria bacterium RIFCSPHIGHO2_12_FULL_42_33]OGD98933.1 MAG: hypothetical protein A3B54_01120 [Candidatus Curtissbacteria bacterium RIFCSPLOWO2_01_FULL_42_50]OGE03477.1 MAG: hypothetical protein A3G16_02680 [Candidatus Curtissbacteria bacterium RIFCSPLOWO2_12_FULL_41_16]OGE11383.1 MAG: hypothetical protein A3H87_05080 [Can